MTASMTPAANGRSKDRRSLAAEIDRFDRMIDGLDKAIPEAVADAVREAVAPAVAEALRTTLLELASNPDLAALLRGARAAQAPPAGPRPSALQRLRQSLSGVARRGWDGLASAACRLTAPVRRMVSGGAAACRQLHRLWDLRRPLAVSMAAGVVVGAAGYASAPWLAGLLAGSGAACTALLGQFAIWARRLLAQLVA